MSGEGRTDRGSAADALTVANRRSDRLVCRDQTVGMLQRHRRLAAHLPREPDDPVARGEHGCARRDGEVDPAVARVPALIRLVVPGDHRRLRRKRRSVPGRSRFRQRRHTDQESGHQGNVGKGDDKASHYGGTMFAQLERGGYRVLVVVHEDQTYVPREKLHRAQNFLQSGGVLGSELQRRRLDGHLICG